ncbi:peptidoglycan/LPS O-acetylase OafA/YrhL [Rhodoferax ferrireducens]|uniref:Peptidoglycan/LPS O-acetylase OafA/YrhL n=1 Tax=Rhodoferax ferrireducens TaxID=192843 RepID=A0ABU2C6D3_9BURK|nr:acyltransferase [Rhodoferax ferrireducens]MDR7376902.1 peptidoglycan/LPS O-acetylase OafA/YrhL [Rhodoferax ferrireducens]
MTQRLNDTTRLNSLDGLRGFAVLLVFFVHFAQFSLEGGSNFSALERSTYSFMYSYGPTGVDLFFALSGYLIYDALIRQNFKINDYIKRRVFRIYPVFLFILGIYASATLLGFHREKAINLGVDIWQIGLYLFLNLLLIPLLPTVFSVRPLVTATWSLAYEMLFYILGPLLARPTGFYKLSPQKRISIIIFISISTHLILIYYNGFSRPLMFFSGIIVNELARQMKIRCPSGVGIFALLLSPLIVTIYPPTDRFPAIEIFFLYGLLLFETVTPGTLANNLFSNSLLCKTGVISYSFYLCHTLLLRIYLKYTPFIGEFFGILNLTLALFFVFLISWLMYQAIEKPFITYTHNLKKRDVSYI